MKTKLPAGATRKNPIAVALGRMARGVPKTLTDAERERRRQRAAASRERLAAIFAANGPEARRIRKARREGQARARQAKILATDGRR